MASFFGLYVELWYLKTPKLKQKQEEEQYFQT